MQEKKIVAAETLKNFATHILEKAGAPSAHAKTVAESLVFADLRGVASHGVTRLASYVARIEANVLDPKATVEVVQEAPASALLDAHNGFGQTAGVQAMAMAIEKAEQMGIAMVGVRSSNHFGVAAYYTLLTNARKHIGIVMTNAAPAMAPFNGTKPLLGTNPLAIGIPTASGGLVLDMATTAVARGKIRRAAASGQSIPLGWGMDADGRPTTDAKAALKGSLSPMGGPKGSGLSFMIDILSGVLTGSTATGKVKEITDISGPAGTGHCFISINIARFVGIESFFAMVQDASERIHAMPAVEGEKVFLPGEIEAELENRNLRNGIALPPDLYQTLQELGTRYNVAIL